MVAFGSPGFGVAASRRILRPSTRAVLGLMQPVIFWAMASAWALRV
ncbi:Uncharacterised protein [Mycobacteroides abscessus subsp. abscessus]|nr:Uncharacterised protein [Mycobacteroides abscessus subsp. abscessus]